MPTPHLPRLATKHSQLSAAAVDQTIRQNATSPTRRPKTRAEAVEDDDRMDELAAALIMRCSMITSRPAETYRSGSSSDRSSRDSSPRDVTDDLLLC
jgi:hypothetical protein